MRGAFNTTCDLAYGPISPYGTPYLQYASALPCRFVPQRLIDQQDFPLSLTSAWMTLDAVNPNHPKYESTYLSEWHANIFTADRVTIASHPGSVFYPIRSELVSPFFDPAYYRVELLDESLIDSFNWLPPSPPATPYPQPSCMTAGLISYGVSYAAAPGPGIDQWGRFLGIAGVMYSISVTFSTDPALVTNVLTGTCGGQTPLIPPIIGNGFAFVTPTVTGWVYVQSTSLVGTGMFLDVL